MKKEFRYCDRCNANLTMESEVFREITIQCISEQYEGEGMREMELCDFCYGQLIGFIGKLNPFTGRYFAPIKE